jgi:dTDP-glucose pyrophosphorylase
MATHPEVNIVIPMAGLGQRFSAAGVETPKALLPYGGRPLYAASTECMPLTHAKSLVFVASDGPHADVLINDINSRFSELPHHVVTLCSRTRGQAETVLHARDYVEHDLPLLIHNVDTLFDSDFAFLRAELTWDALVGVCRDVPGDQWSFVGMDESQRVVAVVEKRRISNLACTGLYGFKSWELFESTTKEHLERIVQETGEAYVAPLIGAMAEGRMNVQVDAATWMLPLGTPEEYAHPIIYRS